eukprot:jgi/Astpho2/262/Aster-02155
MVNHTSTGNHYLDVIGYFEFWPSMALAIVALCCFGVAGIIVSVVNIITRTKFMWICTFFCMLEISGFGCRISVIKKPSYPGYVSMQGRLVQLATGSTKKHRVVSWFFFSSDIFSLGIQGAGAGVSTSAQGVSQSKSGKNLLLAGLALQLFFFIVFSVLTVFVHMRPKYGLFKVRQLVPVFVMLYVTIILLFTRNLYRVIEFGGGFYSRLAVQEGYFYVLDSLLMIIAVGVYTTLHPGFFMVGSELRDRGASGPPRGHTKHTDNDVEMASQPTVQ